MLVKSMVNLSKPIKHWSKFIVIKFEDFFKRTNYTNRTRANYRQNVRQTSETVWEDTNCGHSLRSLGPRFVRPISRPFREKWENFSSLGRGNECGK